MIIYKIILNAKCMCAAFVLFFDQVFLLIDQNAFCLKSDTHSNRFKDINFACIALGWIFGV